jgi:hypothetical protein
MGSLGVLVIGDDWREQLERYKTMEYADPLSPHIVHVDILSRELERYLASDTRRKTTFASRVDHKKKLDPGEEPDFSGKHRWGWVRLNEADEVIELVERTVPGAFFWYFLHTCAEFLLKPGATGWDIDGNGQVAEVTEGYAGSARLSDIDFHAMRQKQIDDFQERWDAVHRATNGKSWIPFAEIRRKYPQPEKYDARIEQAAINDWGNQHALQKIYKAHCTSNYSHEALDLLLLPRADYVRHCAKYDILHCTDVIRYGQHLSSYDEKLPPFNEAELLAELDDDALLTMVAVKC